MSTGEFYFRYVLPDGLDLDTGDAAAAAGLAEAIRGRFGARLAAALRADIDPVQGYVTVSADPEPHEVLAAALADIGKDQYMPEEGTRDGRAGAVWLAQQRRGAGRGPRGGRGE